MSNISYNKALLLSMCSHLKGAEYIKNLSDLSEDQLKTMIRENSSMNFKELPILTAKWICKQALTHGLNRYPEAKKYIDPEQIEIAITDEEAMCILDSENAGPAKKKSLYFIVASNIIKDVMGKSLSNFKAAVLGGKSDKPISIPQFEMTVEEPKRIETVADMPKEVVSSFDGGFDALIKQQNKTSEKLKNAQKFQGTISSFSAMDVDPKQNSEVSIMTAPPYVGEYNPLISEAVDYSEPGYYSAPSYTGTESRNSSKASSTVASKTSKFSKVSAVSNRSKSSETNVEEFVKESLVQANIDQINNGSKALSSHSSIASLTKSQASSIRASVTSITKSRASSSRASITSRSNVSSSISKVSKHSLPIESKVDVMINKTISAGSSISKTSKASSVKTEPKVNIISNVVVQEKFNNHPVLIDNMFNDDADDIKPDDSISNVGSIIESDLDDDEFVARPSFVKNN